MSESLATFADYVGVLTSLKRRGIAPSVLAMLQRHFAMPNRIATMRILGEAAGFSGHKSANRIYGGFAGQVRRRLRLQYDGFSIWSIASWPVSVEDDLGEFSFQMREEFAQALVAVGIVEEPIDLFANLPDVELSATEGEVVMQLRIHRKRERSLRDRKVADVLACSPGRRLLCEVPGCGFDFEAIYGEVGRGYIQVHHTMPLASRINPATTRLEDLILVCANCHAMIHVGRANRDPKELIRG